MYVRRKGISKTATFKSKREAQDWARRMEERILSASDSKPVKTLAEILHRYEDEVVDKRRSGAKWERAFLRRIENDQLGLSEVSIEAAIEYRERRLKEVQGTTVAREMSILSHACNVAIREWKWLESNPFSEIKKPRPNPPRERRITQDEIDLLERVSGYSVPPETNRQKVFHAFLFALETAMRAGEIESLTWDNVNLEKRTAFLPMTKNGTSRTVPLSKRAVELLNQLSKDRRTCFGLAHIPQVFNTLKRKSGIQNLHFHDTRHEAITRLSRKLDVLTLARVVGHKRIQQLMTYYNESAEDIALRL